MPTETQPVKAKTKPKSYRDMSPEELAIAIEENRSVLSSHFDPEFMRHFNGELLSYLGMYFRPEYVNFDEMPERADSGRPLIFASNHSGMAFPWDAIVFGAGMFAKHNYEQDKLFRALAAPMLSASSLMNPYLMTDLWKKVGALDATGLNFETLMNQSETNILLYPEGVPGIGKGFHKRYKMQTFSTSMIRMAIKYQTDIISVFCINGEWINPFSYANKWLNRQVNKIGMPYLPVALQTPLLFIFPWLFYYSLPAKLIYVRGKRYKPYEMTKGKSFEEMSREEIAAVRDEVQKQMQLELDGYAEQYGKKPYRWGELFRNIIRKGRKVLYWTPLGWPALFTEYDRRYYSESEPPKRVVEGWFKFWKIVIKNPIVLAYYIPFLGWIPIMSRGLRDRKKVQAWEGSKS